MILARARAAPAAGAGAGATGPWRRRLRQGLLPARDFLHHSDEMHGGSDDALRQREARRTVLQLAAAGRGERRDDWPDLPSRPAVDFCTCSGTQSAEQVGRVSRVSRQRSKRAAQRPLSRPTHAAKIRLLLTPAQLDRVCRTRDRAMALRLCLLAALLAAATAGARRWEYLGAAAGRRDMREGLRRRPAAAAAARCPHPALLARPPFSWCSPRHHLFQQCALSHAAP